MSIWKQHEILPGINFYTFHINLEKFQFPGVEYFNSHDYFRLDFGLWPEMVIFESFDHGYFSHVVWAVLVWVLFDLWRQLRSAFSC